MAVAAARFRARLAGQADPAGERGRACHVPPSAAPRRGLESDQVAAARGRLDAVIAGLLFMGGMRRSEVTVRRSKTRTRRARPTGSVIMVTPPDADP